MLIPRDPSRLARHEAVVFACGGSVSRDARAIGASLPQPRQLARRTLLPYSRGWPPAPAARAEARGSERV